ncbi:MAG: tetratricopeptide repeat protein [Bacteroidota bacterium]
MKTFLTILLATTICITGYSQKKPKVNKIEPALKEGNYSEAKMIIDEAIIYEKTKDDPEVWFLRGQVYAALDTANNEPGALEESLKAFDKALELDPEQKKISSVDFNTGSVVNVESKKQGYYSYYYNNAINAYNDESFESAAENFEMAFYIMPSDTNAILNAAYSAAAAELDEKAKSNFEKAYEAGSTDKNIFLQLYNYAVKEEDLEKGLDAIQKGREVYPEDLDLMKYEVNLYIQLKRTEEARKGLEEAIAADPENVDLLFSMGVLQEEVGNVDTAIEYYKKAISIDPNHFNSNFNYAVYVFNRANEMMKERNALNYKEEEKIDELTAKINAQLEEALPLWEKLYAMNSTDQTVLETLGYIYTNLKMDDMANKISDELEAVKG